MIQSTSWLKFGLVSVLRVVRIFGYYPISAFKSSKCVSSNLSHRIVGLSGFLTSFVNIHLEGLKCISRIIQFIYLVVHIESCFEVCYRCWHVASHLEAVSKITINTCRSKRSQFFVSSIFTFTMGNCGSMAHHPLSLIQILLTVKEEICTKIPQVVQGKWR